MARPKPRAAPVTRATWSVSSKLGNSVSRVTIKQKVNHFSWLIGQKYLSRLLASV